MEYITQIKTLYQEFDCGLDDNIREADKELANILNGRSEWKILDITVNTFPDENNFGHKTIRIVTLRKH